MSTLNQKSHLDQAITINIENTLTNTTAMANTLSQIQLPLFKKHLNTSLSTYPKKGGGHAGGGGGGGGGGAHTLSSDSPSLERKSFTGRNFFTKNINYLQQTTKENILPLQVN